MNRIQYFVMDVDGTLTDGKIYMGENGELMKAFHIKDGYGIHDILPELGITPVIITGRESEIVIKRCKELGITYLYQGVSDKLKKLIQIVGNDKDLSQVAFIGDDMNDYLCMQKVRQNGGIVACPSDATKKILEIANYRSRYAGGDGAVRDFIDFLRDEVL